MDSAMDMAQPTRSKRPPGMPTELIDCLSIPHPAGTVESSRTIHEIASPAEAPDFASLHSFVKCLRARKDALYTTDAQLHSSFTAALHTAQVVSFDIFDTALLRYVDHPQDVFFHLEQEPAFAPRSFPQPISRLRVAAEHSARAQVFKLIGVQETNLLEIYQVFCDLSKLSRDFAPAFVEAEEQVELRLCVANQQIHQLYEQARRAGKRTIFISDTYHDDPFLVRLLQQCGYQLEPDALFASCAFRKSKYSGLLFPHLLKSLGIEAQALLHVGDHPHSDDRQPRALGIRTILHSQKSSKEQPSLHTDKGGPTLPGHDTQLAQRSVMRGFAHLTSHAASMRGHSNDFWWKFGYSSVGPLTVGFCQWLEQGLRADSIEHAYFLLRDGALLHRVYQVLSQHRPDAVPSSAIPSSRRAMLLPALEIAPAFVVQYMLAGVGKRPVREYLERLKVPAGHLDAEARAAGFTSLDEPVDARFDMNRLLQFVVQKNVTVALVERSRKERITLETFLAQEKVTTHKHVAIVDLGYAGTIQKSLQAILSRCAPETRLTGYYMATHPDDPLSSLPPVEMRSYLAHRGKPADTYSHIRHFLKLFDDVYSSTDGSLLYFEQAADVATPERARNAVVPVLQSSEKTEAQRDQLERIHAGAIACALDFRNSPATEKQAPLPPQVAAEQFFRAFTLPTSEEALYLGEMANCDNLGSTSMHAAARLRATADPAELLEDYRQSHWKEGTFAMATPASAALRTLVWLMMIYEVEDALLEPEEQALQLDTEALDQPQVQLTQR